MIANGHVLELNVLCTIDISGVGKDADGHEGTDRETFGSLVASVRLILIASRKEKLT
jgi:hypothetical protein